MPALTAQKIEVETRRMTTPSGIGLKMILVSEPCRVCIDNAGTYPERYQTAANVAAMQLPPHLAARVRVTRTASPRRHCHFCRSHAVMLLGEQRVDEILGENA